MDQTIITTLGASSTGILILGLMQFSNTGLQLYQMHLDGKKENSHKQNQDLQTQIDSLKNDHSQNKTIIINLQQEVYELRKENGELRGLLQAQEDRDDLVAKYIKKSPQVKLTKS